MHPGCELSVSLCHGGLHRLNSPRPQTPRPVFLDGTRDGARHVWRLHLRSSLRHASVLSRRGATDQHVSGSFHSSYELLFSFRSDYSYTIGLWTCLGLGGQFSHIRSEIQVRPTRFTTAIVVSPTGQSPSSVCPSRQLRLTTLRPCRRHISVPFPGSIQLGLYPFHSPLLRASLLLSLPAFTMMIRFKAFPTRGPSHRVSR